MLIILFVGTLIIHLIILVNLQFTAWPEMTSYPYLLNNGFDIYKDIALPYVPILVLILSSIYNLFGYSLQTLQIFTWTIILFCDFLIFLISLKILGKKLLACLPVVFYVLVQSVSEGNMLWFDLATTPFILIVLVALIYFNGWKKFFLIGFFLMMASLVKQQVAVAFLPVTAYLLMTKEWKNIFLLMLGTSIPALGVLAYIFSQNIWDDFLFWTVTVPAVWYPRFPGYSSLPTMKEALATFFLFTPGVLLALKYFNKLDLGERLTFLTFIALFITAFPRFAFFRLQPAMAVYFVLLVILLKQTKIKFILFTPIIIFLLFSLTWAMPTVNLSPRFYGLSDLALTSDLKKYLRPQDYTYLLGISSTQYVLTATLPPKPWIDNYVWYMEIEGMQEKLINGLKEKEIMYIFVLPPQKGQWFELGTYQPQQVTDYIKQNYHIVGSIRGGIQVWQKN